MDVPTLPPSAARGGNLRLLLLLLVLAAGMRTWQLCQTEVATRDSISYIRYAWQLETAFSDMLSQGGLNFVDRSTSLRLTDVQQTGKEDNNVKRLETKAIKANADMIMEVLATRDSASPLGYGFRITLKNIKTQKQTLAFYTVAQPPIATDVQARYVATDRGYAQVTDKQEFTADDVGKTLALDTMQHMNKRLYH